MEFGARCRKALLGSAGVKVEVGKVAGLIYGFYKGLQSPEIFMVKIAVCESSPFTFTSDGD
jgi:hypothetical protein